MPKALLHCVCVAFVVMLACAQARAGEVPFTDDERAAIRSLSLDSLTPLPPDTTNRVADLPAAAALGATLFFEPRLSGNGQVACSTCHKIDRQFQDDLPRAVAVGQNTRRTMSLAGVGWAKWLFWDGRRDSLWAQALTPLEDPVEHAGNRTAYARLVRDRFRDRYERIFGPLPSLEGVPQDASPLGTVEEQAAWASMTPRQQEAVDTVFANIGKAIAAFERSLTLPETRFDRFARALAEGRQPEPGEDLSPDERAGLRLFVGKAGCIACHSGPRFTDDRFHARGVPPVPGLPEDLGRETGVGKVKADPFNCFGRFRDGGESACAALRSLETEQRALRRAFKTPSLRGVADRPPYMHAGQFPTLGQAIDHEAGAGRGADGQERPDSLSGQEKEQLAAFLRTLFEEPARADTGSGG